MSNIIIINSKFIINYNIMYIFPIVSKILRLMEDKLTIHNIIIQLPEVIRL